MSDVIKILLVDDNEDDYIITNEIVKRITQRKYQLEWVSNYKNAIERINTKQHDIYLIDYRLGIDNGLDLIKICSKKDPNAPFILLTGQGDLEIDEQAMNAGASDYLIKGKINSFDLERSIRYSIQNFKHLEEIRKLNIELEDRVTKRTSELFNAMKELKKHNEKQQESEKEVRKALEKEKELNEMKSRFVTIASHEFRTPLTIVLSATSLIARHSENHDHEKILLNVQRIQTCVSSLTGLLNDFLSLSQVEEASIHNNPVELSLKNLLEGIKENFIYTLKKDQRLIYFHTGTEIVEVDKQILTGIVNNLLSNAIKYSEKGTIELTSEIKNDRILISVRDEGIGIPEEEKKLLFSRFFRAKNTGNIPGTGLGLNIVYRYLEILNGKIDFTSELGKGSIFKIEIPT